MLRYSLVVLIEDVRTVAIVLVSDERRLLRRVLERCKGEGEAVAQVASAFLKQSEEN
jgi:hypothetical protein